MPKKPSMVLTMADYPRLSTRRWYKVTVGRVSIEKPGVVIELFFVEAPEQAGRQIVHSLPAVLAPGSPLCEFLSKSFGLVLSQNEQVDLSSLVGRQLEARFTKPDRLGVQAVAAVRPVSADKDLGLSEKGAMKESPRGLGQDDQHGG